MNIRSKIESIDQKIPTWLKIVLIIILFGLPVYIIPFHFYSELGEKIVYGSIVIYFVIFLVLAILYSLAVSNLWSKILIFIIFGINLFFSFLYETTLLIMISFLSFATLYSLLIPKNKKIKILNSIGCILLLVFL